MRYECGVGQIINQQEQNKVNYYQTLVDLKNTLLKINIRQSDYNLYNEAAYYIEILKRNPNFDKLLHLSQDISDIERYLSKNANLLIFSFIFQAIVITQLHQTTTCFVLFAKLFSAHLLHVIEKHSLP